MRLACSERRSLKELLPRVKKNVHVLEPPKSAAGDCKLKPLLVYPSENPRALERKSKADLSVIFLRTSLVINSYIKSNVIESLSYLLDVNPLIKYL